jgi:hypothetical protein
VGLALRAAVNQTTLAAPMICAPDGVMRKILVSSEKTKAEAETSRFNVFGAEVLAAELLLARIIYVTRQSCDNRRLGTNIPS